MSKHNHIPINTPPQNKKYENRKGRPKQSTKFSTQPRSIVSQMLEKMITEDKIIIPIEWNPEENTTNLTTVVETTAQNYISIEESNHDQIEECFIQKSKKKRFIKSKKRLEPTLYSCDFSNCLYNTKLSSNLQKHKRIHTGEKPFLCDRCSFRTNFSNSLRVHKRLHTTERPYQCTQCVYRCNSISNLKKHSQTKHKDITNPNKDT